MKFTYVDITTKGCEGWLNLFFGDDVIALIDNKSLADEIRTVISHKYNIPPTKICENKKDYVCVNHNLFCSYPECKK